MAVAGVGFLEKIWKKTEQKKEPGPEIKGLWDNSSKW